jgi:hypothetical protein
LATAAQKLFENTFGGMIYFRQNTLA